MATLNTIADEITGALNRPFDWQFQARVKSIFRNEAATIIRQAIDKDGLGEQFKTRFSVGIEVVDDSSLPCGSECGVIRSTSPIAKPIRFKTDDPFSFIGNKDGTIVYLYTKRTELPYADLTEAYLGSPQRYVYENGYMYLPTAASICGVVTNITDYSATVADTLLVTSTAHGLNANITIKLYNSLSLLGSYAITIVDDDSFYITGTEVITATKWLKDLDDECLSIEGAYPVGDAFDNTSEAKLNNITFTDDTALPLPDDLIQAIKLKLIQSELRILDSSDKAPDSHLDN
jgi:hypothetical protein